MDTKFLDKIAKPFDQEVPFADTLDGFLDQLLPIVRPWSEDLYEQQYYLGRPWLEIRDDENFHEIILHFFNEDGEYLKSVNGDISSGTWRYLESANKLIIDEAESELYDLAFLDGQFFVLVKHGDQQRFGQRKYFVMAYEAVGKHLEWHDAMLYLFNKYRNNNSFYITIAVIILLIIAIILVLS